mmetsp:Transcript_63886/g.101267  ORF Transcript_63886/g.101267 Transcript_63886/m.101267 type:complete len:98 (-) Transcript_63886:1069-1362(-)
MHSAQLAAQFRRIAVCDWPREMTCVPGFGDATMAGTVIAPDADAGGGVTERCIPLGDVDIVVRCMLVGDGCLVKAPTELAGAIIESNFCVGREPGDE